MDYHYAQEPVLLIILLFLIIPEVTQTCITYVFHHLELQVFIYCMLAPHSRRGPGSIDPFNFHFIL